MRLLRSSHYQHTKRLLEPAEGVRFSQRPGWAHDWITHWTDPDATARWPIKIVRGGNYSIAAQLSCGAANVDCELVVELAGQTIICSIDSPVPSQLIIGPERAERKEAQQREWQSLHVGSIALEEGVQEVIVRMRDLGDAADFKLKGLTFTRIDYSPAR